MVERGRHIESFLSAAGWAGAARTPLAGDASGRTYQRLQLGEKSAVLMDSPGEDIGPFCRIARHLDGLGYSAPRIYAEDGDQRLLLLEDLGDLSFINCLDDASGAGATELYGAAVDVLADLSAQPLPPGAAVMDAGHLAGEISLFSEWWPMVAETEDWSGAWRDAYQLALVIPSGLALRDFHAGNLMWFPARSGNRRVGLLDFQDALIAPISYDLVSLLQDARRDVPEDLQSAMIARFTGGFQNLDQDAFRASYAVLGAHRNLRIAGVFSRLAAQGGKREYLRFLPRVWRHIEANLRHPALAPVAAWLADHVPADQRGGG